MLEATLVSLRFGSKSCDISREMHLLFSFLFGGKKMVMEFQKFCRRVSDCSMPRGEEMGLRFSRRNLMYGVVLVETALIRGRRRVYGGRDSKTEVEQKISRVTDKNSYKMRPIMRAFGWRVRTSGKGMRISQR